MVRSTVISYHLFIFPFLEHYLDISSWLEICFDIHIAARYYSEIICGDDEEEKGEDYTKLLTHYSVCKVRQCIQMLQDRLSRVRNLRKFLAFPLIMLLKYLSNLNISLSIMPLIFEGLDPMWLVLFWLGLPYMWMEYVIFFIL